MKTSRSTSPLEKFMMSSWMMTTPKIMQEDYKSANYGDDYGDYPPEAYEG